MKWYPCSYSGGDGDSVLDIYNYSSKIGRINNRLTLDHGSYVGAYTGTNGSTGYVNFARIKIINTYNNYPCVFLISGRGWTTPALVCVNFSSSNTTDPALHSFYTLFSSNFDIYLYHSATSQWDIYVPKNEAYGRIDILHMWYSSEHFEISFPNVHFSSASSSWVKAVMAGIVQVSNSVRDANDNNPITFSKSLGGLPVTTTQWIAAWNGYQLRAIDRNAFIQAKSLNEYWGMCAGNYEDDIWIRTTQQGIIPYQSGGRGSGHCQLGAESWYFLRSYIDTMFAVALNLTGTITSSVSTSTYLNGAKGVNVGINMTAPAGFNIIAKVKSTNGRFILGCYNSDFQVYYIADNVVDANQNSYTYGITLMNENGHLLPMSSNSRSLGSISNVWKYLYVNNITPVNGPSYLGENSHYWTMAYINRINFNSYDAYITGHQGNMTIDLTGNYTVDARYSKSIILRTTSISSSIPKQGVELINPTGSQSAYFRSLIDGGTMLGDSNYRWNGIYSKTSSISTSDRREKKNISYIGLNSDEETYMSDDTLQAFIRGLLPCIYLRIDGDSGRPHHGLISQDVEELLKKLGIKDHAGFIKSPKTETIEIEEEVEEEYVDETDGQTKTRTVTQKREEQREIPGEYVYGLRYEEFIADLVRFVQLQDERIESLEKRIGALENIINQRAV